MSAGSHPQGTIWNARRRALGNLIPFLFWAPPNIAGLVLILRGGDPLGPGLWLMAAGLVTGGIALNIFGFWDSASMRAELAAHLGSMGLDLKEATFVGFASPAHAGLIDAHEDVGFLVLGTDLTFVSEVRTVTLLRSQIKVVRFRSNIHSLLGLGRWVSVEGTMATGPFRLLIEPREKPTLLANRRFGVELRTRIEAWRQASASGDRTLPPLT
ncbi:MAG: hypothetical protein ACOYON_08045 [Fimbriimonas sp.]